VREYFETGSEALRAAARAAAWYTARAATRDAAWDAARGAARDAQNNILTGMVEAEHTRITGEGA